VDGHEIEVWHVDLEGPSLDECATLLTRAELDVAGRGRPAIQRERIVSRAALRVVLGARLGCRPSRVRLTRSPEGKPQLDRRRPRLEFSLSHAAGRCAIAVSRRAPVGVDVEGTAVPLSEASLREWTRQEARLKARGIGLTTRVQLAPVDPGIAVVDLRPGPGHVGAVAIWTGTGSVEVDVAERVLPASELAW
jgi:4'-phosphopantetheinyl transferase